MNKSLQIKKGELKKIITDKLFNSLNPFGYQAKKNPFIIMEKTTKELRYTYSIDLMKWSYGFEFVPYAHVTFLKAECFEKELLNSKEDTYTIGNSVEAIKFSINNKRINHQPEVRFQMENDSQIDDAHVFLMTNFFDIAQPYFEKHSNLAEVEYLVNGEPYEVNNVHCPFNPGRMYTGIILAKICERSDFMDLVEIYNKQYETVNPSIKKEFDKMVSLIVD